MHQCLNMMMLIKYFDLKCPVCSCDVFLTCDDIRSNRVWTTRWIRSSVSTEETAAGRTDWWTACRNMWVSSCCFHHSKVTVWLTVTDYQGRCCGMTDSADWLKNSYIQSLNLTNAEVLPCSCFSSYRPSLNSSWCSEQPNFTSPLYGRGNSSHSQVL